jgi:hypothetical protein
MKKLLLTMTAAAAFAAPAAAQTGWQNNGYQNNGYQNNGYANANAGGAVAIDNRLARLDARIQAGIQSGAIDQMEAQNLRMQLREISRLDRRYGRNGYTQTERRDMQQRLRAFRDQLNYADGGRGGQYGNGYYGQGGPYEEVCETNTNSGGLGGLIGSIFGGGSNTDECAGLRIGQRVSGNLGAVPYQYRNRYRDTNNVYHRSDGRQIYQIDARTNTVVRIYGM